MFRDKFPHQFFAFFAVNDDDLDSFAPKVLSLAFERHIFTHNNSRNAVQKDGAGTHAAWTE